MIINAILFCSAIKLRANKTFYKVISAIYIINISSDHKIVSFDQFHSLSNEFFNALNLEFSLHIRI